MENATLCDPRWTTQQTVEHFQQQINLPVLKDMLTTFFKARTSDKGNMLLRRPPIAVRLLDGDEHVHTIRPGWEKPYRLFERQHYGELLFDKLYVDAIHQTYGKCAKFWFDDMCQRAPKLGHLEAPSK